MTDIPHEDDGKDIIAEALAKDIAEDKDYAIRMARLTLTLVDTKLKMTRAELAHIAAIHPFIMPRSAQSRWRLLLRREEQLAAELDDARYAVEKLEAVFANL